MSRKKKWALGCLGALAAPPAFLAIIVIFLALAVNGRVGVTQEFASSPALLSPPPALNRPLTLKIITYNIADAYLFTFNRPERIRAIAAKLVELDPDIIGFQEAFIEKDRELLYACLKESRLQHHAWFPSGLLGSGLLIMSAWPIEESCFHRFAASNPWYKLWEGDWWAGKGCGLARIVLPENQGCLDFYNTHAQAGRGNPEYIHIRYAQFQGMADFINASRSKNAPAFLVGDMNTERTAMDYTMLLEKAGLTRRMSIDTRIDHIFSADDERYAYEVIETAPIRGGTQGHEAAVFLSALPTWEELKKMLWGGPEMTSISDHSGYMSTLRITPKS